MFFDQQAIEKQLAVLREGLADPAFRPARRTSKGEELKEIRKAKNRERVNAWQRKTRQNAKEKADNPQSPKAIAKRVKEIVQARKVKKFQEGAPAKVNDGHLKLKRIPGEKSFPVRIGGPDLSGHTRVQVDAKTCIYVKEGKDIQEAVERYRNRHNLPAAKENRSPQHIQAEEIDRLVKMGEL